MSMGKKFIKYKSDLFQQEVTLIIDKKLNRIDEKKVAPEKLAEANKDLKNLKLPQPQ